MSQAPKHNHDSMIGKLVVEYGLATPEEVEQCRRIRRRKSGRERGALSDALVAQGIVTNRQIERLKSELTEQRKSQQIPGFQILERLGAGAMATVYKARQLSLDRMVAVKVLPKRLTRNPQFVERFYAEGRAAAKLNHPNIVAALDVGQAGDFHYFAMEYVEGRTVFDDITEKGVYAEDEALGIVVQVARALEHAHRTGFIHRDVKPKNVMITKEGTAKLADMGLARAVSDRQAAEAEKGKAFGTPYYIAPEQIRGQSNVDFRADIYSLGCTLYHMVTGGVPFDGPNPSVVMHKHLKAEPVPPDQINPTLSSGIGEVIEVCMSKDRKARYASTTDLLHDLEALLRGEPPVQARKKFELSSLTALEESMADGDMTPFDVPESEIDVETRRLSAQPVFWAAIVGWLIAVVLTVVLIVVLTQV